MLAIGPQGLLRGDDTEAQPHIPPRTLLDLEQDGATPLLDLRNRVITSNSLDLIHSLAVQRKQLMGAPILVVEPSIQFNKFRLQHGAISVVQNAFRGLDR